MQTRERTALVNLPQTTVDAYAWRPRPSSEVAPYTGPERDDNDVADAEVIGTPEIAAAAPHDYSDVIDVETDETYEGSTGQDVDGPTEDIPYPDRQVDSHDVVTQPHIYPPGVGERPAPAPPQTHRPRALYQNRHGDGSVASRQGGPARHRAPGFVDRGAEAVAGASPNVAAEIATQALARL